MHQTLKATLLRVALAGACAIGLAASGGAAQAVDIKMWTLTNAGYPEYIAMATEEF